MSRTTTSAGDLERLAAALSKAAAELVPDGGAPVVHFEAPRNPAFGDLASNVALQLAKRARRPPQQLATEIVNQLFTNDPGLRDIVAQAHSLGGFINVRLAPAFWQRTVARILRDGDTYGRGAPTGERVSLEFGSANPTGPLVVVQGRTLSLGDSIAKALRFTGIDVTTEWLINDAGSQFEAVGRSLYARYRQLADPAFPFPEDGYPGTYLIPIARKVREREGDRYDALPESEWLPFFSRCGRDEILAGQEATCARFGVHFDRWQSEKELHEGGAVMRAVERLGERELTYESDGAIWMRTTLFGDDKDRVLVRKDGRPTYYAPDIAYHEEKLERNERAVLILGPDHHGYVARLNTIAEAFGRPGAIKVLIAQQMTTIRDGVEVSSSKRRGELLTLDDILDEIGVDAARFFFVMSSPDSPMTFDLTLAKAQSSDNPVFYVQYGHARIASLVARAPADLVERARCGEHLERLVEPAELALARRLDEFPSVVAAVAESLAPHRLVRYAQQIASDFTQFYMNCKVLTDDPALSSARLAIALAAKQVLASTLGLLGVSAPERM